MIIVTLRSCIVPAIHSLENAPVFTALDGGMGRMAQSFQRNLGLLLFSRFHRVYEYVPIFGVREVQTYNSIFER